MSDREVTQQAEPVGEVTHVSDNGFRCEFSQHLAVGTKLYIAPPLPVQPERQPLDEWVIDRLANNIRTADPVTWWRQLARDVENAHNIKEKP